MSDLLYPTSLAELSNWQARHRVTADEARKRFVQFVVLESIASDPRLMRSIVLKGGNALRFVYGSVRSTADLDFSADDVAFPDDDLEIRAWLNTAFRRGGQRYQVKARCQRVRRNPKNKERTLPTYDIAVGYQIAGDRYYPDFETSERDVPSVVPMEITLNDVSCEVQQVRLDPASTATIRVGVIEDILAEKLRALLQQRIRNRARPQDVLDIARIHRQSGSELDCRKIGEYLIRKAAARSIEPKKRDYDDDIKYRASVGYEEYAANDPGFLPLEEAWSEVLALVARLEIPD